MLQLPKAVSDQGKTPGFGVLLSCITMLMSEGVLQDWRGHGELTPALYMSAQVCHMTRPLTACGPVPITGAQPNHRGVWEMCAQEVWKEPGLSKHLSVTSGTLPKWAS